MGLEEDDAIETERDGGRLFVRLSISLGNGHGSKLVNYCMYSLVYQNINKKGF